MFSFVDVLLYTVSDITRNPYPALFIMLKMCLETNFSSPITILIFFIQRYDDMTKNIYIYINIFLSRAIKKMTIVISRVLSLHINFLF